MVGGTLTLRNMALREDCLSPAPFAATGSVGTIFVRVPWAHLDSQPCRIEIDTVFAMLRPAQGNAKQQAEASARFALRKHDKRIKKLLDKDCKLYETLKEREKLAKKAEKERQKLLKKGARTMKGTQEESQDDGSVSTVTEMGDDGDESEDEWDEASEDGLDTGGDSGIDMAEGLLASKGWVANMAKRILANLQISVHNVHLRYETEYGALGITLASLEVKPSAAHFYSSRKDIEVSMLSVYCDVGELLRQAPVHDKTAFSHFMREGIPQTGSLGSAAAGMHMYIIPPSLFSAFVEWPNTASGTVLETQRALGQTDNLPKAKCCISVTTPLLKVEIHQEQYQGIIAFVDSQPSIATEEERERRTAEEKQRKLINTICCKPKESPKETPKAWWRYAAKVIREQKREDHKRLSPLPSQLFSFRQKSYEELFRAKWLGKKTGAEKVRIMEQDIPLEQTFLFRSISLKHCRSDEKFMHSYRKLFKKQEKKKKRLFQNSKEKSQPTKETAGTPQTASTQGGNGQLTGTSVSGETLQGETKTREKASSTAKRALQRLFHRKHKETKDKEGSEQTDKDDRSLQNSSAHPDKKQKLGSLTNPECGLTSTESSDFKELEKQFSVDPSSKTLNVLPQDAPLFDITLELQLITAQVYQNGKKDDTLLDLNITRTRANLKLGRNPRQELSAEIGNIELSRKGFFQQSSATSTLSLVSTHCTGTPFMPLYYLVSADGSTRFDVSLAPTTVFADQDTIIQGCKTFALPHGRSWNSISEKVYGWVSSFTSSDKSMREARDIILGELPLLRVKPMIHGMILNIELGSLNVIVPTPGVYDPKEASIICLECSKLFTCTDGGLTQYDAHTLLKMSFQGNKLGDGVPLSASVKLYTMDTEKAPEINVTIGLSSFNITKQNATALVNSIVPLTSLKTFFSPNTDQSQDESTIQTDLSTPKIRNGPLSMLATLPHDMRCTISIVGMKISFSDDRTQLMCIQLNPLQIKGSVHNAVACIQTELMIKCEENEQNKDLLEFGTCFRGCLGPDGIVNIEIDISAFNIQPSIYFLMHSVNELLECFTVTPTRSKPRRDHTKGLKLISNSLSFIHMNIRAQNINLGIPGTPFVCKLDRISTVVKNNIKTNLGSIVAGVMNEKPLVELVHGVLVCSSLTGISCTWKSLRIDTTGLNVLFKAITPIIESVAEGRSKQKYRELKTTKDIRGNLTKTMPLKCQISVQETSVLFIGHTLSIGLILWDAEQGTLGSIKVDGICLTKTTEHENKLVMIPGIKVGFEMALSAGVKASTISLSINDIKARINPEDVLPLLDSLMMISFESLRVFSMLPKRTEKKQRSIFKLGVHCEAMDVGLKIQGSKGFGLLCDDILVNFVQTEKNKELTATFQWFLLSGDVCDKQILEKEEKPFDKNVITMKTNDDIMSFTANFKKLDIPAIDVLFIIDSIPTLFKLIDGTLVILNKYPRRGSKVELSVEAETLNVSVGVNETMLSMAIPQIRFSTKADKSLTIHCGPVDLLQDDRTKIVTVTSVSLCSEQTTNNYSMSLGTINTCIDMNSLKSIFLMVQCCTKEIKTIGLDRMRKEKTKKKANKRVPDFRIDTETIICILSLNDHQESDKISLSMTPFAVSFIEGKLDTTIMVEALSVLYHSAMRKEEIMRNQRIVFSGIFNTKSCSVDVMMNEFSVNAGSSAICSIARIICSLLQLPGQIEKGNTLPRIEEKRDSTDDTTTTTIITTTTTETLSQDENERGHTISGKALLNKLKFSCHVNLNRATITWKNKAELEFSVKGTVEPKTQTFGKFIFECFKLKDAHRRCIEHQGDGLLYLKGKEGKPVVEIGASIDDKQDSLSLNVDVGEIVSHAEIEQLAAFVQDIEKLQTRLCVTGSTDEKHQDKREGMKKGKLFRIPENMGMNLSIPHVLIQVYSSQRQLEKAHLKHNVNTFAECSLSLRCTINKDGSGVLIVDKIAIYAGSDSSIALSAFLLVCHEISTSLQTTSCKTPKLAVRFRPVHIQVHRGLLEDYVRLCKETRELFHKPELSFKADRLDTSHRAWPIPYNEYRKETSPTVAPLRFERVKRFMGMPLVLDVSMASLHTDLVASDKEKVSIHIEPMSLHCGNQLPCAFEAVLSISTKNPTSQHNVVLEPLDCLVTAGYLPYPMVHICTPSSVNVRLTPDALSTILLLIRGKGFSLKDKKQSLGLMEPRRSLDGEIDDQDGTHHEDGEQGEQLFRCEIENSANVGLSCVATRNGGTTEKTGSLVSFRIDGWEEMPFVSLSATSHQAFCQRRKANMGEDEKTLWLLARMKEETETKTVVEVIAPITLENTLQYPLEVAHPTSINSRERLRETSMIYPKKGEPIHVLSNNPGSIKCIQARIVLTQDKKSDWFDIPFDNPLEAQEVRFRGDHALTMFVNSTVKSPGSAPVLESLEESEVKRVRVLFLTVKPGIIVHNKVPLPVTLRLTNGRKSKQQFLEVAEVEQAQTFGCSGVAVVHDKEAFIVISAKVGEHNDTWSTPVEVHLDKKASKTKTMYHLQFAYAALLNVAFYLSSEGQWHCEVCAPCWYLNTTGIPLELDGLAVVYPSQPGRLGVFCPSSTGGVRVRVRAESKEVQQLWKWTNNIAIHATAENRETPQTSMAVLPGLCPSVIRVVVDYATRAQENTLVLTFVPAVVFQNGSSKPVQLCQPQSEFANRRNAVQVEPGYTVPVHYKDVKDARVSIKIGDYGWSTPFSLTTTKGPFSLRLWDEAKRQCAIVPLETSVDAYGTRRWVLRDDEGVAPCIVQNFTGSTVRICQKGAEEHTVCVGPRRQVHFAWDNPEQPRILCINSQEIDPTTPVTVVRSRGDGPGASEHCIESNHVQIKSQSIYRIKERCLSQTQQGNPDNPSEDANTLEFEAVVTLPGLRIVLEDNKVVTCCVLVQGGTKTHSLMGPGFDASYKLGKGYDEVAVRICNVSITSDDKEVRHGTVLCCVPGQTQGAFLVGHLKRMLPGSGRKLVDVQKAELQIQDMLLMVDEELLDAILFFIEKIVPAEVAESYNIEDAANRVAQKSKQQSLHHQDMWPLFIRKLSIHPISFRLAFTPRQHSSKYRSKMSSWLSWGCSVLGSITDTEVVITGFERDCVPYREGFAPFKAELQAHYLNEISTKILGASRGSGAFGTTLNFFARLFLVKK